MRYTIDTEFYERPGMIELISIAVVGEDGREYYAENVLFDWQLCNPSGGFNPDETQKWLWNNVHPSMGPYGDRKLPREIADEILEFVSKDGVMRDKPEFWGYYCDYDWVVFCWIYGRMLDLPRGFPMYCLDIKQVMHLNKIKRADLPQQVGVVHNALDDARWMMTVLKEFEKVGLLSPLKTSGEAGLISQ